jgi:hypothetical protein
VSRKNECLTAVTDVLDDAQIAYIVKHGGKHMQILFTVNGRDHKLFCAATPSDWRAQHNKRAQIRRLLRVPT